MTAVDPKRTLPSLDMPLRYANHPAKSSIFNYAYKDNNDKAKPAERRGRKATGPRFLLKPRMTIEGPKIAGLPDNNAGSDP